MIPSSNICRCQKWTAAAPGQSAKQTTSVTPTRVTQPVENVAPDNATAPIQASATLQRPLRCVDIRRDCGSVSARDLWSLVYDKNRDEARAMFA